jgi:hypothetical protein
MLAFSFLLDVPPFLLLYPWPGVTHLVVDDVVVLEVDDGCLGILLFPILDFGFFNFDKYEDRMAAIRASNASGSSNHPQLASYKKQISKNKMNNGESYWWSIQEQKA